MAELARARGDGDDEEDDAEPYDPADGRWSHTDMLLGLVVDELRASRYASGIWSGAKPPKPRELRRPGYGRKPARTRKPRKLTPEQRMRIDPRARRQP